MFVDEEASFYQGPDQSEFSTCLPGSMSRDDMRSLSEVLDKSLENPSAFGSVGREINTTWDVQSKEDILKEVKQQVQAQKPWRQYVDEAEMERRRKSDRQDRMGGGFFVIMPDHRVRAMDTMISRRVRAQLFDDKEDSDDLASSSRRSRRRKDARSVEEGKPKPTRKVRNPWYLPAQTWYTKQKGKDVADSELGRFPYDVEILRAQGLHGGTDDDNDHRLDGRPPKKVAEIESLQIVDAYKQHMRGLRLPHFLL